METFGQRLRKARKDKGVTQTVAAKAVGMSQANLSDLENDVYPTSSYTPQLAVYYNVSTIWLADGRGSRKRYEPNDRNISADLQRIIELWPQLSEEAHRSILLVTETLASPVAVSTNKITSDDLKPTSVKKKGSMT